MYTILDFYTDEPAGLGVPPFLGTYPRYIAGAIIKNKINPNYLTVDDLRYYKKTIELKKEISEEKKNHKTDISIYNRTRSLDEIEKIIKNTKVLIIICGIHVPGKYLSAIPGNIHEVERLASYFNCFKIFAGPAASEHGTQLEGGKKIDKKIYDFIDSFDFVLHVNKEPYLIELIKKIESNGDINNGDQFLQRYNFDDYREVSLLGSKIVEQHPLFPKRVIVEIETGKGCSTGKCSFCTEPLKNRTEHRVKKDIYDEVVEFYKLGIRSFRLGKQSDFFMYQGGNKDEIESLLKDIWSACPDIENFHIDNVSPRTIVKHKWGRDITKLAVKYFTEGNITAFGAETFDPKIIEINNLNSEQKITMKAIEIVNEYGSERGPNGMPKLLPGLNLLFGLPGETKKTHEINMKCLKKIYDEGLLLRRINIRRVVDYGGTKLSEMKKEMSKTKRNQKYYWKWRNDIRQNIDNPMLKRIAPEGLILKNLITEIYDGNITFARHLGTYPLIVGIKGRIPLNKKVDVKITKHQLRSLTGEVVKIH